MFLLCISTDVLSQASIGLSETRQLSRMVWYLVLTNEIVTNVLSEHPGLKRKETSFSFLGRLKYNVFKQYRNINPAVGNTECALSPRDYRQFFNPLIFHWQTVLLLWLRWKSRIHYEWNVIVLNGIILLDCVSKCNKLRMS